jgi:hypothetical protein
MLKGIIALGLLALGLSLPSCIFTDSPPPDTVVVEQHKEPDHVVIENNKPPDVNVHVDEHHDAPPAPAPPPPPDNGGGTTP